MKTKWPTKKLGDVLMNIQNGVSVKQSQLGTYAISRIETVQQNKFDIKRVKYAELTEDEFKKYKYLEGDIAFSHINSWEKLGKVARYKNEPLDLVHGVNLLRFTPNKDIIDSGYLELYLMSSDFRNKLEPHIQRAINQASVNQTNLKKIEIPLPPLKEQKRIVRVLEEKLGKVKQAIQLREQVIADTEKILSARLTEIFTEGKEKGWEEKTIGEVLDFKYGKGLPKSERKEDGPNIVYGANGELGRSEKFLVEGEGIIVGRKGSAGQLQRVSGKYWPTDVTYYIQESNEYNIDFIFHVLSTLDLPIFAKGVKPGINRNEIYALKMLLPDLKIQEKIVKELDELSERVSELKNVQELQLADLRSLERAYLHEAFAGELV